MNVLQKAISGLRNHRVESARSGWESYFADFVAPLAMGQTVDTARLAELAEELSVDEDRLTADVEKKQQRYEWARVLEGRSAIEQNLSNAQNQQSKLLQERADYLEQVDAKIGGFGDEIRTLEHELNRFQHAEQRLGVTVMDPGLIEQEKVLLREASEHRGRLANLREDLARATSMLSSNEREIKRLKGSYSGSDSIDKGVQKALASRLKDARSRAGSHKARVSEIQREILPLEKALAKTEQQIASLQQEKLIP